MTTTLIFLAGILIGVLSGTFVIALFIGAGRMGDDESNAESYGYVDQDGESTPSARGL